MEGMTSNEKGKFLYSLRTDPTFLNSVRTLFTTDTDKTKYKIHRDEAEENKLIDEIIENFDFSIVRKVVSILPAIDEEYAFYNDCLTYQSEEALKDNARETLKSAFKGLHENPEFIEDQNANVSYHYYIGGIFEVDVFYDLDTKKYDAKLTWNLQEWCTF